MAIAAVKRMTQKEFWAALAKRAKKYGFIFSDGETIRECKTGKCPMVAVAAELGIGVKRTQHLRAATELGLSCDFAELVADSADSHGKNPMRRKLLKACNLPR